MPKDVSESDYSEVLDPSLHYPYFDWGEDDGYTEVFLLRNNAPELTAFHQRIAQHAEIVSFSVSQTGYERINDLIASLSQMRDYILERIAPADEMMYNNGCDRTAYDGANQQA